MIYLNNFLGSNYPWVKKQTSIPSHIKYSSFASPILWPLSLYATVVPDIFIPKAMMALNKFIFLFFPLPRAVNILLLEEDLRAFSFVKLPPTSSGKIKHSPFCVFNAMFVNTSRIFRVVYS